MKNLTTINPISYISDKNNIAELSNRNGGKQIHDIILV